MANFAPFDILVTYDLAEAIVIFLFALLIAMMINVFMKNIVLSFFQKTKTSLDDNLVKAVKRPVFLAMLLFGLYLALRSIESLNSYSETISKATMIIGFFLLFMLIHRIINEFLKWYATEVSMRLKGHEAKRLSIFGKVADILMVIVFSLILMWYLGINVTPILASLGIGGLAVALALQETLSNFFAGLSIIGDKSLKVGDYIELENAELAGYIEDISWRTSRIRTIGGDYIIVPNTKLSQSVAKDYSFGSPITSVGVTLYVGYMNDLEKVEKITNKVALEVQTSVEGAVRDHVPLIRFKEFQDSNIRATVFFKVNSVVDKFLVVHEFMKRIKKAYEKNNIEISYPITDVYLRKKNISKKK